MFNQLKTTKMTKVTGIEIARQCGWDGAEICKLFFSALTDANFHSLRKQIENLEEIKEFKAEGLLN